MLTRRILAGAALVVACSAVAMAQQPPPINYFGSSNLTLSPFVRGSVFSWHTDEIGLIVLWRGGERWYSPGMKSGGSGNAAGYTGFMEFGSKRIDFSYDRSRRIARIRPVEVSMTDGHNVLLVDGVDRAADGLSTKPIRADLTFKAANGPGRPPRLSPDDIMSILRRSEEITAFLKLPDP